MLFKNAPSKWKLAAIFSFSFTLCFTTILFIPFDLFLNNPTDFIVSWRFIFWPLVITAITATVMVSIACLLLNNGKTLPSLVLLLLLSLAVTIGRFVFGRLQTFYILLYSIIAVLAIIWILLLKLSKENAFDIALHFAWGVVVSAYVQMLFMNNDMVRLTGDRAAYGSLTLNHVFNGVVWIIIAFLPLCLRMVFKIKKISFRYEKAFVFTMILISGMQIAGLVSTAVSTELPVGYDEDITGYISYESTLHYNTENNIVVFILDRLDVSYMSETLDEYPELYDKLDGFTFYKNNVSEFGQTFPSVTTMLTQSYYNFDGTMTFSKYWEEAWAQHNVIDTLRENGFTSNLYIDLLSTYGTTDQIRNRTDNLRDGVELLLNPSHMLVVLGRLSLGRLSPYLLKNFFLAPLDASFGNEFFTLVTLDDSEVVQPSVSQSSDMDFYRYLKNNELTAESKRKVFNFIHLNCSHVGKEKDEVTLGYHYDEDSGAVQRGGNYLDTTRACFEMLNIYFNKMKEIGVYENSTIIMLGDHGIVTKAATGLLIKPRGSTGSLKIDADAELSNKYLGAGILEAAGIPHSGLGLSYFDIINGAPPPVRKVYYQTYWFAERNESEIVTLQGTYEIPGDANDFDNWIYSAAG